jgi:hypothetical protein
MVNEQTAAAVAVFPACSRRGYVPTSLDPVTATGPRRAFTNGLANRAFKSLLVHWNVFF